MESITQDQLPVALTATRFVFLDFHSPGCAPCKAVKPLLEEVVAAANSTGISCAAFDVDITVAPQMAQNHFVLGVPTIIMFRDGQEIQRFNAVPKKDKLLALLK